MLVFHKTATTRNGKASRPLRAIAARNPIIQEANAILDFGCGRGEDVAALVAEGFNATGYDPNSPDQSTRLVPLQRHYDVILMTYVANVIPMRSLQKQTICEAFACLAPGGTLYITTRTRKDVDAAAIKGSWHPLGDGRYSVAFRHTQQGFDALDLAGLVHEALIHVQPNTVVKVEAAKDFTTISIRRY